MTSTSTSTDSSTLFKSLVDFLSSLLTWVVSLIGEDRLNRLNEILDTMTEKMTDALVARQEPNKISIGFIGGDIPMWPPIAALSFTLFFTLSWFNSGRRLRFVPKSMNRLATRLAVAAVFFASGLSLIMATRQELERVGTVPNFQEVVQVACQGPYKWTRNGMYIGLLLVQTAIAVACDSSYLLLSMACMALYLDRIVVPAEEDFLVSQLRLPYIDYRLSVPRWIVKF